MPDIIFIESLYFIFDTEDIKIYQNPKAHKHRQCSRKKVVVSQGVTVIHYVQMQKMEVAHFKEYQRKNQVTESERTDQLSQGNQ